MSELDLNSAPAAEEAPHVEATESSQTNESELSTDAPAEPIAEAEQDEEFSSAYSEFQRTQTKRTGEQGRQMSGTVVAKNAEFVFVDIGFKSEGVLPLSALASRREPVEIGDTVMVSVKGRSEDGLLELSLFSAVQPKDWTSLEQAFAEKAIVSGIVTAAVKGGLRVDVGVPAFLPASRTGTRDAAEMEKLVGQEIRCRITKLDVADEDVVVDRRAVLEEEAAEAKGRRLAEVHEGDVLHGTVRSLMDYGAFVDMGGLDGLLHVSDISWTRINKAADVLEVGQQVEVKVLKMDAEGGRISLGMKQLQPHPWDAVPDKFKLGDRVRGTVTRIADFGAFVELAPGIEGLVHLSEMSWSKRIHKATEVMNVGDTIEAVILAIDAQEKRISLGLKQTLGDPWVEIAQRITVGSVVEGPVASITKFGAFIQVAEGVQGLVHISEIAVDRRLNHPSDVLRVGEVVKAQVLEIDKEKRQLRLSMKQLVPTGLDEFLAEHAVGDSVTGRVISAEGGVARVELGEGIVASCTLPAETPATEEASAPAAAGGVDLSAFSSMLKTKWKAGAASSTVKTSKAESAKAGQVRSFRITQLDAAAKSIELSLAD